MNPSEVKDFTPEYFANIWACNRDRIFEELFTEHARIMEEAATKQPFVILQIKEELFHEYTTWLHAKGFVTKPDFDTKTMIRVEFVAIPPPPTFGADNAPESIFQSTTSLTSDDAFDKFRKIVFPSTGATIHVNSQ